MIIKRLKETREKLNLKQKDLAKLFEVNFTTVSGWETGKDTMPLKHLIKYSNTYNFSIDYLLGLSNENIYYNKLKINKEEIGINLKRYRKKEKLTIANISKKLNCSISCYCYYENGRSLITTTFLYGLKDIYNNFSADEILGRKKL